MIVKKTIIFLLSVIIFTSMIPSFSYAVESDENLNDTTNISEGQNIDETTEQSSPVVEEREEPIKAMATKSSFPLGSFRDDGAEYTMEDTSVYTKEMKIYAIFMHRKSGQWNSKDRYGDATLIESNGKYLLMDTGTNTPIKNSLKVHESSLVDTLKSIGVKNLDIYISHMHGDHTGGLAQICNSFKVEHVFLPDIETCKNYITPDILKSIDKIYSEKTRIATKEGAEVVYLAPSFRNSRAKNVTNKINVGAVTCNVIGPVGTYTIGQFKSQDGNCGSKEGHYLNNCSLSVIMQCGDIRFFSGGDIEKQEEERIVRKYGSKINVDVMKISHHGLGTSNTQGFMKKTSPFISFEENHGYSGSSISSSINNAQKYGFNGATASRKYNIVIAIKDNNVKLYKDKNRNGKLGENPVTGWVSVRGKCQYYSKAGNILRGWQSIKGKKYYFSANTGFRYTGSHTVRGTKCRFSSKGVLLSPTKPQKVIQKAPRLSADNKIVIRWTKVSRANRYIVYRSTKKSSGFSRIAVLPSKRNYYKDNGQQNEGTGLEAGKNYYYKIKAYRIVAGTILYGPYSNTKLLKVK